MAEQKLVDQIRRYSTKPHLTEVDRTGTLHSLLNLFLVYNGVRRATLVESANFISEFTGPDDDGHVRKSKKAPSFNEIVDRPELLNVLKTAITLGMNVVCDGHRYPRFLVSKIPQTQKTARSSLALGKILGYKCAGHDFHDEHLDRTIVEIWCKPVVEIPGADSDVDLYTEICEPSKIRGLSKDPLSIYRKRLCKWNTVLKRIGYKAELLIKTSTVRNGTRREKLLYRFDC